MTILYYGNDNVVITYVFDCVFTQYMFRQWFYYTKILLDSDFIKQRMHFSLVNTFIFRWQRLSLIDNKFYLINNLCIYLIDNNVKYI